MIDTPEKRCSAIATRRLPWIIRRFAPLPTGTIDQAARQHLAGMYSGILAGPPIPTVIVIRPAIVYVLDRPPITFTEV